MRYFIAAVLILFLTVGCRLKVQAQAAVHQENDEQLRALGIKRFYDDKTGALCYMNLNGTVQALSCYHTGIRP